MKNNSMFVRIMAAAMAGVLLLAAVASVILILVG